jgi:chemotaxis methyl-accepting protein methylase
MNLSDDPGFALLLERLAGHPLPPLDMYKDRCLRRRLAVRMRACGVTSVAEYARMLDQRPEEVSRLLATLTINVTQFFRNPEAWARLGQELGVIAGSHPNGFTAWSAGCASGEEAYSLAMQLAAAWSIGGGLSATRLRIDATDVDEACLAAARGALYPAASFRDGPRDLTERWTTVEEASRRVLQPIRSLVRVARHDLGRDPPPMPPYDLVVCRNVLIYFERETQEKLFQQCADALKPGGLLFLGKVEMLYGPARARFETVDHRERLYRRVA